MVFLKKYYKIKANSILESVIALSIISICIYFAVLIFAIIFSPRTTVKFYTTQNNMNELFYLYQINSDLVYEDQNNENFEILEEDVTEKIKQISIKYKDTLDYKLLRNYYIQVIE